MCKKCLSRIKIEHFFLFHDTPTDFLLTKISHYPILYAIWSTACAAYTLAMGIFSVYETGYGPKILIWLTYWTLYCLICRFTLTACNAWVFFFNCQKSLEPPHPKEVFRLRQRDLFKNSLESCILPWNIATQWFLQNMSNTSTLLVGVLFWTLIYTGRPQDYASINAHAINSVLVLGDVFVSRAPVHMLHFHMPLVFLIIYILFTLIYWASGGRNHRDMPYVYDVLDYGGSPLTALTTIFSVAIIGVPLMQGILLIAVKLRDKLHSHCKDL